MRKIILFSAMSLNGKIAKADGSVGWLETIPNPSKSDFGYHDFYASIDTTIMGNSTYQQVIGWDIDFPYPTKKNYVLTRQTGLANTEFVEFISEPAIEFIKGLKAQEGKDIWLIGGGQVNTLLLNHGLIDELTLHVMPIVLSDGIELFENIPDETRLELLSCKDYDGGVVEFHYSVGSKI